MFEDLAPQMARVLAGYSLRLKEGAYVVINTNTNGAPLAEALYEAVLEYGANPVIKLALPHLTELFLNKASDAQLVFVEPGTVEWMKAADVYVVIDAPGNTKALTTIDPARVAKVQQGRAEVNKIFFERLVSGDMGYVVTLWPTDAAAQQAEMGLLAYREFVYKACGLDRPDPIAHWTAFRDQQTRLADWLKGKHRAEVRGPGVELSFDFTGRAWISCHGELNFPDGEIFTCPVEDSVNGRVAFSYPSLYQGKEVRGVRLTFKDGLVVEASADKGQDVLLSQLDLDAGARRLGEFAIGTNMGIQQYTGNTLFDEKIGGTIHMAVGNSAPYAGGQNHSSVHWDIVHGMRNGGEIRIDGELFYQNGAFVVE